MVPVSVFLFYVFFHLQFLYSAETSKYPPLCPSFNCGKLGDIRFPFTQISNPDCGLYKVNCSNQKIQLENGRRWLKVDHISEADTISINDPELQRQLDTNKCNFIDIFPSLEPKISSFQIVPNITLFKCKFNSSITPSTGFGHFADCNNNSFYFTRPNGLHSDQCSTIHLPGRITRIKDHNFIRCTEFQVRAFISLDCSSCHFERGGQCQINSNGDFVCSNAKIPPNCKLNNKGELQCANAWKGSRKWGSTQKLAFGLGVLAATMVIAVPAFFIWCRHKRKYSSSNFLLATTSNPYTKSDMDEGHVCFGIHIFSYAELEEATHNFDSQKELGDGAFGAVYYGKLQDGREVAVKRLYEHNYRRVKQFLNEIEILTQLRHENLVSLYGCTSLRSRELLLTYEYVPNGTVADHLHGDQAKSGSLTWPIRLRIAVETASALAYLHASDIVHRDVKTNNILLDSNFSVKVADFGLSRFFPIDATHISTAPQGSPGYVDPEYYNCYQLTDKSDVYSFGVVLAELISSMPAVDITRDRHEINLANLTRNKIQRCAFDEFIDPRLGYKSDEEVKRTIISVAELAFLCLQQDKEMRPSMDEIVEQLKIIASGEYQLKNLEKGSDNA